MGLGRADVGRARAIVPGCAAVLLCRDIEGLRKDPGHTAESRHSFYLNAQGTDVLQVFVFHKKGRYSGRNARSNTRVYYKKYNNKRKGVAIGKMGK